jgi:hypothetical protein
LPKKRNPLASWEGVPEEAGTLFYEDREHRLGLLRVDDRRAAKLAMSLLFI